MALREILTIPDKRLTSLSLEVLNFNESLASLLDDMRESLYAVDGIGLAAPQIGENLRVIVLDVSKERSFCRELVNPVIVEERGKIISEEGCLSIPEYRDSLIRKAWVRVKAHSREGEAFEIQGEGLLARCLQHEIDHLDGVLFTDRLSFLKQEYFTRWFKKQEKDPFTGTLIR